MKNLESVREPEISLLRVDGPLLLVLLAIPVAIFWRPYLFFIWDDWTELWLMSTHPFWRYLTLPNGEQWFPIFHVAFYGLIRVFGDHYSFLVLVNCLGTGVNVILFYLFLRRHLTSRPALLLSLLYSVAAVHYATTWMAFYFCFISSLSFFLLAILATDRYCQSSSFSGLLVIGLCAWLSIHCHNYTLLGLGAIPIYALLMGQKSGPRQFWSLTTVVGVVFLSFTVGYFSYAGLKAATSHNQEIFYSLLTASYLKNWFWGAFIYPFCYLFWGDTLHTGKAFILGMVFLGLVVPLTLLRGSPQERHLLFWGLLVNALPFLLVAMARHHIALLQAGTHRYAVFSLVWALLVAGNAWQILSRNLPPRLWSQLFLPLALLSLMVSGQFLSTPNVRNIYLRWSQVSKSCYQTLKAKEFSTGLSAEELDQPFCPQAHPFLTHDQAVVIKRYLQGRQNQP